MCGKHTLSQTNKQRLARESSAGFTLIELSILLIVVGLLASAFFAAQKVEQKRKIIDEKIEHFEYILTALGEFVYRPQDYYREDDAGGGFFGAGGIDCAGL